MYPLEVCVGSSCHLKGSYAVINELKRLIMEHSLENRVELKGCFCLGKCKDGVSMRLNGEIYTAITITNVKAFFETEVIPQINAAGEVFNGID